MDIQTEFNQWLARHKGYWASLSNENGQVVLSIKSSHSHMPEGKISAGSAEACYLIAMHCPEHLPWMLSFDMEVKRAWSMQPPRQEMPAQHVL